MEAVPQRYSPLCVVCSRSLRTHFFRLAAHERFLFSRVSYLGLARVDWLTCLQWPAPLGASKEWWSDGNWPPRADRRWLVGTHCLVGARGRNYVGVIHTMAPTPPTFPLVISGVGSASDLSTTVSKYRPATVFPSSVGLCYESARAEMMSLHFSW